MMNFLRIFAICVLVGLYTAHSGAQVISTYSLDNKALLEGKKRVSNGDKSVSPALEKLKISAERLLKSPNVNVTQKKEGWKIYFPKGYSVDSHEYVSFSIYFYPDTAKGKTWQDPWINIEKFGANDSMRYKFDYDRNSNIRWRMFLVFGSHFQDGSRSGIGHQWLCRWDQGKPDLQRGVHG